MPALFDLGTISSSVFGLSHPPQSSLYLDSLPTDLLSVLQSSPSVESEVLADISHVALDLITFTSPTRALLRLSLVLGRCLAIAADWVPDHYLHPEELAFQSFMLSVSVGLLVKTALPLLPAVTHQSSNKYGEKRAYGQMFKRHGGLSWVQTKMILAGGGAEWFELGGGEVVVMDEQTTTGSSTTAGANDDEGNDVGGGDGGRYLYWLQKGEAELLLCGGGGDGGGQTCLSKERAVASIVSTTSTTSSESAAAGSVVDEVAILGELEFARRMQDQSKAKAKKSDGKKSDGSKSKKDKKKHAIAAAENMASTILKESSSSSTAVNADPPKSDDPSTTTTTTTTTTTKIRAGPSGVTLLRLDADRLLALISDDEALADGIRSIVFAGMQDKLRRVMAEDGGGTADGVPSVSPSYEPDF